MKKIILFFVLSECLLKAKNIISLGNRKTTEFFMERNNLTSPTQPICHLLPESNVTWRCLWKWRKLHWKAKKRIASHKSLGKFHDKFLVFLNSWRPKLSPVNPWAMCVDPKDTLLCNHFHLKFCFPYGWSKLRTCIHHNCCQYRTRIHHLFL